MERVIKRIEPKADGVVKRNNRGVAILALPVNEQFSTKTCVRCEGLLVSEWTYDLQETGYHKIESLRCVQCGNRIDPVILQNQLLVSGRTSVHTAGPPCKPVEEGRMTQHREL